MFVTGLHLSATTFASGLSASTPASPVAVPQCASVVHATSTHAPSLQICLSLQRELSRHVTHLPVVVSQSGVSNGHWLLLVHAPSLGRSVSPPLSVIVLSPTDVSGR